MDTSTEILALIFFFYVLYALYQINRTAWLAYKRIIEIDEKFELWLAATGWPPRTLRNTAGAARDRDFGRIGNIGTMNPPADDESG